MSRRDEILKRIKDIPELPTVALKVINLVKDPDYNIKDLQKHIELAPSLAANVLKIANSAYYAGPRSIGTIREAIMRLGSETILDLVVASSVSTTASQSIKGYQLPPGALWEHMVATALATSHLASHLNIDLEQHAFTSALLHDIGKVLLGSSIDIDPEPIMNKAFEEGMPFEAAEREVLGIDHAEAGAALLESWNLPDSIIEIVRWHHEPEKCPNPDKILDIVHVANNITIMSGVGRGADGLNYRPSPEVIGRMNIKTGDLEVVMSEMLKSKEELTSFLGGFSER